MSACSNSPRALAGALLLLATVAGAQVGTAPLTLSTNDINICFSPWRLELPSGAFAVTDVGGGVCQIDAAATFVRGDQIVGNVLGEAVAYDGGTTALTCGGGSEGRFQVLDNGKLQLCRGDTSTTVYEPLMTNGITGGQTAAGGTATTDTLTLNPSAATDARGAINLCGSNPDVGANSVICTKLFPNGLSISAVPGNYQAVSMAGTVTQAVNGNLLGNPAGLLFVDNHVHQVTDSALNPSPGYIGAAQSFASGFTIANHTNDNYTAGVGLAATGLYFGPFYVSDGGGTLTIPTQTAVWVAPATIPANVTVSNSYGGSVSTPTVNGTLTDAYGWFANVSSGTNRHPFAAAEQPITGATKAGEGDFGVATGAPNRGYFRNESGHVWQMGWLDMTAQITALPTSAVTTYGRVVGAAATGTEAASDVPTPGALKVYGFSCGLAAAAGTGTMAHQFTLMDNTTATAATCTITTTATNCQYRNETGISIAAARMIDWRIVTTGTPAANEATCVLVYNLDVW